MTTPTPVLESKPGQIAAKTNRALSRAFTEGDDERIGFDDQPGPVRIVAANAQASPCLGSEDFNDPEPRWARELHRLGHDLDLTAYVGGTGCVLTPRCN